MIRSSPPETVRRPRWPWVILALGLIWTVLIRIPLILNAEDHLDSDLAVDGLTLLDALNGQWRWHYPGTPHIGILPMLASYPQALLWGANPIALVSGGTVLWVLVVCGTFWLAWKAYGPSVAAWAILPLVFSSKGTIWLSGRITGGHLLTLVWHTLAFVGLHGCFRRGGRRSAALLGAWCGLGISIDAMFLLTLGGIGWAGGLAWLSGPRSRAGLVLGATFMGGLLVGLLPREIGRRVDPYDAYPEQFAATFQPRAIAAHAGLFGSECLPRLIAGTGLHPDRLPAGPFRPVRTSSAAEWPVVAIMIGFGAAILGLAATARSDPARLAVTRSTLMSGVLIVLAFDVNKMILNSDNYRYLIFLLTPWSLGFGLCLDGMWRRGWRGRLAAGLIAGVLAAGMTLAAFRWYRDTRHYLDDRGLPVRKERPPWSELLLLGGPRPPGEPPSNLVRLERYTIPPDVTHVFGGYWDVYRLSFLSGKHVAGIPFPTYPNRFPGWSAGLGPGHGKMLVLRPTEESTSMSRPVAERPGGRSVKVRSARGIDWHPAFTTVWLADGRDPAELDRLETVVP